MKRKCIDHESECQEIICLLKYKIFFSPDRGLGGTRRGGQATRVVYANPASTIEARWLS